MSLPPDPAAEMYGEEGGLRVWDDLSRPALIAHCLADWGEVTLDEYSEGLAA